MARGLAWLACALAVAASATADDVDSDANDACPAAPVPTTLETAWANAACVANCTPCLVGEEWDALREEKGLANILRSLTVKIEMHDWLSHWVTTAIARILVGDMLGYETEILWQTDTTSAYEHLASGATTLNAEVWSHENNKKEAHDKFVPDCVDAQYLGVLGVEQIYQPEDGTCAVSGVNTLRNHRDIFAPDGTTEITEKVEATCATEQWPVSECTDGRWLPPRCTAAPWVSGAPSPWCAEMLMGSPLWSPAWYEGAFVQLGFNFSAVYLGGDLRAEIKRRTAAGDNFVFYWWEPDTLFSSVKATPIALPSWSEACAARYTDEPTTSGADCGQRVDRLIRGLHAATYRSEPDLANFHDLFTISNGDLEAIMFATREGGGDLSVDDAACAWLQNNTDVWTDAVAHVTEDDNIRYRNRRRRNDAWNDWGWIVVVVAAALVGAFALYKAGSLLLTRYRALRASHFTMKQDRLKRLQACVDAVHRCDHPMVVVRLDVFEQFGKLPRHEDVRASLVFLDTYADVLAFSHAKPVLFVSHQWLAYHEPDPDNAHFAAMCAAARLVAAERNEKPEDLYLWVDFCSVPQRNRAVQAAAIRSLPVFASACRFMVCVCPPARHKNLGTVVDATTYAKRGWCRLEMWAMLCQAQGLSRMFVYEGDGLRPVAARRGWYKEAMRVFEGEFTVEADKARLVDVVLGLHARGLRGDDAPEEDTPLSLQRVDSSSTASRVSRLDSFRRARQRSFRKHESESTIVRELVTESSLQTALFPPEYFGGLVDDLEHHINAGDIRFPDDGVPDDDGSPETPTMPPRRLHGRPSEKVVEIRSYHSGSTRELKEATA